jgi:hypothetical protein
MHAHAHAHGRPTNHILCGKVLPRASPLRFDGPLGGLERAALRALRSRGKSSGAKQTCGRRASGMEKCSILSTHRGTAGSGRRVRARHTTAQAHAQAASAVRTHTHWHTEMQKPMKNTRT